MKHLNVFLWLLSLGSASYMMADVYTVEVGQFEKLKVNGNINVIYKNLPDSTGYARYRAPEGSADFFQFSTKGEGNLKVEPADDKWGANDLPVLCLYSDFLSSVESYSDGTVSVVSPAPCSTFSAKLVGNGTINIDGVKCNTITAAITTGNGSIYLSGSSVNANYRMVGAGLISADRLVAENIKCRILGTGSIGCWPVDNLSVTGLGSTKIYYKGKPNIKKTGGGKLFELPEEMDEEAYSRLGTPVPSLNQVEPADEEYDDEEYDDNTPTVVTDDD